MRNFSPVPQLLLWSRAPAHPSVADVPRIEPEEREFAVRLGTLIAKVRLDKDISQEELAERAGVSPSTIGRWERGLNPPKSYQLAKIWSAGQRSESSVRRRGLNHRANPSRLRPPAASVGRRRVRLGGLQRERNRSRDGSGRTTPESIGN